MGKVVEEFQKEMAFWKEKYKNHPEKEMIKLWLLSLEREEIVSVTYREEFIRKRLKTLPLSKEARTLMQSAIIWVWKDEQMHTVYIRGALQKYGNTFLRFRSFLGQFSGALGGWISTIRQNVRFREAPLSFTWATFLYWVGISLGKISKNVRKNLSYHSFQEFCTFNIEAEQTAALAWGRLLEIIETRSNLPVLASEIKRMQEDEIAHAKLFETLASFLDKNDAPLPNRTETELAEQIKTIGERFLPRHLRRQMVKENPLGSGGAVFVKQGNSLQDKCTLFRQILLESGLLDEIQKQANRLEKPLSSLQIAIKPSFMMGYSKQDLSHISDRELLEELAKFLHEHGIQNISLVEVPNLYDQFFQNRDVKNVSNYFSFSSPYYRVIDASKELVSHTFTRGMGQYHIGRTWKEADFRISFSKMRSHPVEMVFLTLANIEGMGSRSEEYIFRDRQAHADAALMMLLDEFPLHFALLDAYESAADGLVGIMGCPNAKSPLRFYAAKDALALDLVAASHMHVKNPKQFSLLQSACHWFGDPGDQSTVIGCQEKIQDWKSPYHNEISTILSFFASPVYEFWSGRGKIFISNMDTDAFPPKQPEGFWLRFFRKSIRSLIGLQ